MPNDNYEQVKAALWTGKETAAALEALERMHQREAEFLKAVEPFLRTAALLDPLKYIGSVMTINGVGFTYTDIRRLAALADTPEVPR